MKFVLSFHSTLTVALCQDDILKCEILAFSRAFVIWLYFSKTLDPFLLTSAKHAFSDTILKREREGEIREEREGVEKVGRKKKERNKSYRTELHPELFLFRMFFLHLQELKVAHRMQQSLSSVPLSAKAASFLAYSEHSSASC